uniref:Serpentine receptor class gamma n=2 Tax=Bursaphelenchus xylophilus TaxID=6326 RepID=A0A1I7RIN1_BURXY
MPETLYSFENGNYITGTVFYAVMICNQIIVVLFEGKYLLIALERCVAYNARKDYETRGSQLAYKLMGITLFITIPALVLKWTIIWQIFEGAPIDLRLRKTFVLDTYFNGLLPNYVAVLAFVVGAVACFLWLNNKVCNHHAYESSLSERYEIRQTKAVLHYVRSLIISFLILTFICGLGVVSMLYGKHVSHMDDDCVEFKIIYTFLYICLSIYNFTSMLFMISAFPRLQNVIFKDFPFLYGRPSVINSPMKRDHVATSQTYFQQLKDAWDIK